MTALDSVGEVVTSGSLLLAVPLALAAGLISFFSPCVLPLLPGYAGLLGGMAGSTADNGPGGRASADGSSPARTPGAGATGPGSTAPLATTRGDARPTPGATPAAGVGPVPGVGASAAIAHRRVTSATTAVTGADARDGARGSARRVALGAILFVCGFSAVWVVAGVAVASLGIALAPVLPTVLRVAGVLVVVLGLAFIGWLPFLQMDRRLDIAPRAGLAGAPVLGAVFGLGWAPCIGPTLAAVLTLAMSEQSVTRGLILTVAYCLGLGVPFVVAAVAVARSTRALAALRRHARKIQVAGGIVLVALGLLLLTGGWEWLARWMQGLVAGWVTPL